MADGQTEVTYQRAFAEQVSSKALIQAGNYLEWPSSLLVGQMKAANTLGSIKTVADHNYPQTACRGTQTNLSALMDHSVIHNYTAVGKYPSDAAAARQAGLPMIMGETNSGAS